MIGEDQNEDSREFANFRSYACRIIHLKYENLSDLAQIDTSTYLRLLQSKISLLPNLTSLKISHHGAHNDQALLLLPSLLRSQFLESITHHMSHNFSWELGQVLSMMLGFKMNIKTIQLSGVLPAAFGSSFAGLHNLTSVSLALSYESWTPVLFNSLLTLDLVELSLEMVDAEVSFLEQFPMGKASPTIKKLSLIGTISAMYRVLKVIAPQDVLDSLSLTRFAGRSREPEPNMDHIHEAVGFFPSVRALSIDYANSVGGNSQRSHTALGNGRLRSLSYLQFLILKSLPSSFSFSDDDIFSITSTWPFLKILRLEHSSSPSTPWPTFDSLYHLVVKNPQLISLSITVKLSDYAHNTRVSSHNLRALDLLHTAIDRPLIAGRYLDRLFPNLDTLAIRNTSLSEQIRGIIFDVCKPVRKDQQERIFDSFHLSKTVG
jgi:hypothetical protein